MANKSTTSASAEVDAYLQANQAWQAELRELRAIVLACHLTEELKWRIPCYTFQGANVVLLSALKEYCAISFPKGALLKDPKQILARPGENTRAARLIRFIEVREITQIESTLKAYIQEAIELEKSGQKVDFTEDRELDVPAEFQASLDSNPALSAAFEALTPGRQRAYLLHFSGAKQSSTRQARVEKYVERILAGKGINDCTCGLSRKPPGCDGSHKQLL